MKSQILLIIVTIALINCCPDDVNCRQCINVTGTCTNCYQAFLFKNTCQRVSFFSRVNNCIGYAPKMSESDATICNNCQYGYIPTKSDEKVICKAGGIKNCALYDPALNTCLACFSGMNPALLGGSCEENKDKNNNCDILAKLGVCLKCNFGYVLSAGGTGTQCISKYFVGCVAVNPTNNDQCILCDNGFYINSKGTCSGGVMMIVFYIVGAVVLALIIGVAIFCIVSRRRKSTSLDNPNTVRLVR